MVQYFSRFDIIEFNKFVIDKYGFDKFEFDKKGIHGIR